MCREAVWTVLSRALREPWFLKEMFHDPETAFAPYDLTLDEKRALLSGNARDLETCAGAPIHPLLKKQLEKVARGSPCHDAYFLIEEFKNEHS